MAKQEILQIFVESMAHKFMHAADMTDGGTKIFGSFVNKTMTKNDGSNITLKEKKAIITEGLKKDGIAFVRIGNRFGVKKGILSLSNGKQFMFIPELKEELKRHKVKEISYDR